MQVCNVSTDIYDRAEGVIPLGNGRWTIEKKLSSFYIDHSVKSISVNLKKSLFGQDLLVLAVSLMLGLLEFLKRKHTLTQSLLDDIYM